MFNFIHGKPFGIHVTDTAVKVMQLETGDSDAKQKISSIGETSLPVGMVENGEILQEKSLAKIISSLLPNTKPNQIEQKSCILALPEA
jgi:Tfp pilus assembly PilM family ATPase